MMHILMSSICLLMLDMHRTILYLIDTFIVIEIEPKDREWTISLIKTIRRIRLNI